MCEFNKYKMALIYTSQPHHEQKRFNDKWLTDIDINTALIVRVKPTTIF